MSRLVEAGTSLSSARDDLRTLRHRIKALRETGTPPDDLAAFLSGLESEIRGVERGPVRDAQRTLEALQADDLGADAAAAVAELTSFVSAARQVGVADVAELTESTKDGIRTLAERIDVADVPVVSRAELTQRITSFQADIERSAQWSDRISKVVATAVGIGKTAVRVLA